MSSDSMVVEDGVDEAASGRGSGSGWVLTGIAFLCGLALGTIVSLPGPSTSTADEPDVPVSHDPEPEDAGVTGVVPGFPDTLVAIDDGAGVGLPARSGLEHVLWPLRGPMVTRPMPQGQDVIVDATGDFHAMSTTLPDLDGVLLSMGRTNDVRPVRTGVTSYAWHDSVAGALAFTTDGEDGWHLYTITPRFAPEEVPTSGYQGGTVAGWGDWGFVIQSSDDTVLLTASGEFKDLETGRALASHRSGWVLVDDGGLKLVSSGGGVRLLDVPDVDGQLSAAAFSPDGRLVAVSGRFGIIVYALDDRSSVRIASHASRWLSWSSDSRFVISSADSGAGIHDVETGESHRVLAGRNVIAAVAVPLSRS